MSELVGKYIQGNKVSQDQKTVNIFTVVISLNLRCLCNKMKWRTEKNRRKFKKFFSIMLKK
jgi:hypothetical protein